MTSSSSKRPVGSARTRTSALGNVKMRSPAGVRAEGMPAKKSAASSGASTACRDAVLRMAFMMESVPGESARCRTDSPVQVIDSGRQPVAEVGEAEP